VATPACNQGQHPYPAENVFLVVATQAREKRIRHGIRVCRRSGPAIDSFRASLPEPASWSLFHAVPLSELLLLGERLKKPWARSKALAVPEGLVATLLFKKSLWAALSEKGGRLSFRVMKASKSAAVEAHVRRQGAAVVSVLSQETLLRLLEVMGETRRGERKDTEQYVLDDDEVQAVWEQAERDLSDDDLACD
jgi:hypothetical protein